MANGFETWYRGEGVDVPRSKPGGSLHDFGDGVYLTDRTDVADVYATRRATTPDAKRVWAVSLARPSLGRVLDLSADARWQQFMNDTSDRMLLGKSRLEYLKIKQENYGQFFQEFARKYKINVDSFDAVIGPEYNLGGRQLCILHKNGQPSKLAVRVRALFRLATPIKTPVTAEVEAGPVALPKGPAGFRFRAGLRSVVSAAGAIAVQALLEYAVAKLWEYIDKKMLEKELVRLQPAIDAKLAAYTQKALALLSVGRPAYANIVLKIEIISSPQLGVSRTPLVVSLTDVYVSHTKPEGAGKESKE